MKTVQTSIKCDGCQKELIEDTMAPAKYALELKSVNVGINTSNMQWANIVYPPIAEPVHFCGYECLNTWLAPIIDGINTRKLEVEARRLARINDGSL